MPVVRSPRFAAALVAPVLAGALGACVIPPKPLAPRPEVLPSTPPAVSVWSPTGVPGTSVIPALYFSTDRAAYAAVFEVDRAGRARVVFPRTPRETGLVEPGQTYSAASQGVATDRAFLTGVIDWERLPFMFVVVSDARPDLSAFGRGRSWRQQVRVDAVDAEDVVAALADEITARSGRPYATDFAYLAPRLSASEALFATSCALPVWSPKDYWYFRDLWAVFTPADPTLGPPGFALGSLVTWASAPFLGVSYGRAQWATAAFRGSCSLPFAPAWSYRRDPLLFAAHWGLPLGGPVAGGPIPVVTGPRVFTPPPTRFTPPSGATPREPRIPRLPRELADGPYQPAGGPSKEAPRTSAFDVPSPGPRQPRGITTEPLDRPPVDRGRRWGTPGAGTGTTLIDERGAEGERMRRRSGDDRTGEGTPWAGGGVGGRDGVERVGPATPRAEPRPEPRPEPRAETPRPPMREPVSAPVFRPTTGGAERVSPGGGGRPLAPNTQPEP